MATINMHMKFEIEIPKQTWLMLRKPCRLQTDRRTDGQTDKVNPVYPPSNFVGRGYNKAITLGKGKDNSSNENYRRIFKRPWHSHITMVILESKFSLSFIKQHVLHACIQFKVFENKANLRELIDFATGLVTLFGLCDLEIGPMALKNNRDFLARPFQLYVSFNSHQCIQLGLTIWKCSNRVKIGIFFSTMTTILDRWHWKTTGHLSYASSTFTHHFLVISEFKFELQSRNSEILSILSICCLLWPWNFTDALQKQ